MGRRDRTNLTNRKPYADLRTKEGRTNAAKEAIGSRSFSSDPQLSSFLKRLAMEQRESPSGVSLTALDSWTKEVLFLEEGPSRKSREVAFALEDLGLIRQEEGSDNLKITRTGRAVLRLLRSGQSDLGFR